MKPLTRGILLLVLLAGLPRGLPAADRFDRTKVRINALLQHRLHPYPLPATFANPFQLPNGTGTPDPALFAVEKPSTGPAAAPLGNAEILAHYAATLKISGQVQLNGRVHLIINQTPYKEGDYIRLRGKNDVAYYLKILGITPDELTLGYNDAVLAVPLRN